LARKREPGKAIDNGRSLLYNICWSQRRTQLVQRNKLLIYHNPACSKSRATLQLLRDNDQSPEIVEYLQHPPSEQELVEIINMLGISARELLRTGEPAYREAKLDDDTLGEEEIIAAICKFPSLLQRPIVVAGNKAVIGRPPIKVLEIIA
jgi:arsenate reductase